MKNNLILLAIAMMLVSCNKETLVETNTPAATGFNNDVALNGLFSVNEGKQVYFSKGNLQYSAQGSHQCADGTIRQGTWRFAENQWDYVGSQRPAEGNRGGTVSESDNSCMSSTNEGWIDLFGWGTSGYHDSGDPYNQNSQPWSYSTNQLDECQYNYYGYGPSTNMPSTNLTNSSAYYDWGVFNAICNGGNEEGQWRTLTMSEWNYVFNLRRTASDTRFAKATVNDVCGVILLPDDWNNSFYDLANTNEANVDYSCNMIGIAQWAVVESYGAIFLPAGGRRSGLSVESVGDAGAYWSASCFDDMFYNNNGELGVGVLFNHDKLDVNVVIQRYGGRSVRLVRDAN